MVSSLVDDSQDEDQVKDRQIIVSRMEIIFNGKESQLLTLTDITIHKTLEAQ